MLTILCFFQHAVTDDFACPFCLMQCASFKVDGRIGFVLFIISLIFLIGLFDIPFMITCLTETIKFLILPKVEEIIPLNLSALDGSRVETFLYFLSFT